MIKCTELIFLVWIVLLYNGVYANPHVRFIGTGITWSDANAKCGGNGLEYNKEKIEMSDIPIETEFWIGKAVYHELTPWIEVLGCTTSTDNDIKVFTVDSIGHCQIKCDEEKVFGFNEKEQNRNCVCFTRGVPIVKISACKIMLGFLVYKYYIGTIPDCSNDPGNCATLCCGNCQTLQPNSLVGMNCNAQIGSIVSRCEPFIQNFKWGLNYYEGREFCWEHNRLLLPAAYCRINSTFSGGIRAWTNIFRVNFDVVKTGFFQNPAVCFIGVLHNTERGTKELNISRGYCQDVVKHFICKNTDTVQNHTTTVVLHVTSFNIESSILSRSTPDVSVSNSQPITTSQETLTNRQTIDDSVNKTNNTKSYTGIIIGAAAGVFILLLISVVIIVCRKRSIWIFKGKKKTKDNTEVFSTNHNLQSVSASHVEPISNQNYGIAINQSTTYAVVDKLKKSDKKFTKNEATYSDLPDGQYDQLNNIHIRKLIMEGNLYDSHEGIRDQNDPTYDISKFSSHGSSHEVTDVYDHSFLGTQNDEEYAYSSTYRSASANETEMYDRTV